MDRRRKLKKEELSDFPYQMVEEVTASIEEYEKFLDFYSRFYKYNIVNALMIYGQNPDAAAVGTYQQWKSKTIGRGHFPLRYCKGGHGKLPLISQIPTEKPLPIKTPIA